jgi:hypothetical protein
MVEKGVSLGDGSQHDTKQGRYHKSHYSHGAASKGQFTGSRRVAAEQRLSYGRREHIVEIQVQLSQNPNPASTFAVDGYHSLKPDLEISSNPNHTGVDRSGRRVGITKIVGNWRRETRFDNRNQMIEKIWKLKINDLGF